MQTKLIDSYAIAEGTMYFRFEKPAGFEYRAGQNCDFTHINPSETDGEGNKRTFSLASSPSDEFLSIATRLRDTAFKRILKEMRAGDSINLEGPFGDFFLHENAGRAAVMLAGGIGITPFYSMIVDATQRELPHKMVLLYSNRRPEDSAFLEELKTIPLHNRNFTFVGTMTEMKSSVHKWLGEHGYIDAEMIKRHVDTGSKPLYYIAGPLGMLAGLRSVLNGMGVSNDDIRTEEFIGY